MVVVVGGTAGHFVAYNDDFGYHLTIHASQFGCKYSLVCALLGYTMMISGIISLSMLHNLAANTVLYVYCMTIQQMWLGICYLTLP